MAVYFGCRIGQVTLTTLGPDIVASLDITMGLFGLAFTGLSLMSAIAQFPSGVLSDRYGERILILAAVLLTCISTLLLALAPSYTMFLPLMVFVGIGSGLYYSPSTTLLDKLYDRIGRAIGTYRISGQMAGVVGPAIVGALSLQYGWRVALFAMGLLLIPVLGGVLFFIRPTMPSNPATPIRALSSPHRILSILSRPGLAGTTVLAATIQFVEVAAFTFHPAILQQYHGLSTAVAGSMYAVYFATVSVLQPVSGWLSDRFGRDSVVGILLLAGITGFAILTRRARLPILTLAVVLTGVSMTWGAPVQSRFMDALEETERGVGFGLVRTLYLLVGSLGGYVVGNLVTERGWAVAFGTLTILLGLCLVGVAASQIIHSLTADR